MRVAPGELIREALERYLAGVAEGAGKLALSHAFLAGVGVGLELGRPAVRPSREFSTVKRIGEGRRHVGAAR